MGKQVDEKEDIGFGTARSAEMQQLRQSVLSLLVGFIRSQGVLPIELKETRKRLVGILYTDNSAAKDEELRFVVLHVCHLRSVEKLIQAHTIVRFRPVLAMASAMRFQKLAGH
jgi:hypothetical protein